MKNKTDDFLCLAAFFAPDLPLPMDFLAGLVGIPEEALTEQLVRENRLVLLPVGAILAIPQQTLPAPDRETAVRISDAVIEHLEQAFRHHNKVKQLETFRPIGPHMVALIETLLPFGLPKLWKLYQLMAQYLVLVGKAEEACGYFGQAAVHFPEPVKPGDQEFTRLRLQTADAETSIGNTEVAAALVRAVIEDEIQLQGHPSPLHVVRLAHISFREDDYTQAIRLYQQAIQLETDHSDEEIAVAAHWNNLGRVYLAAGQIVNAIAAFQIAAGIWERTDAEEHHVNRALALKNLALAYQEQENYAEAQSAIEEAIQCSETAYGPDHPDIGRDANIYALILQAQGEHSAALEQFRRALRIDTHSFGQHHPEVALTLNNMGTLYAEMGDMEKARQNFHDARAILQQCSSEDHPYWQQVLENITRLESD